MQRPSLLSFKEFYISKPLLKQASLLKYILILLFLNNIERGLYQLYHMQTFTASLTFLISQYETEKEISYNILKENDTDTY